MDEYKYSGMYSSVYTFFDRYPEVKPHGWEDVWDCDVNDIQIAVGLLDYQVVYGGDWSMDLRIKVAQLLGVQRIEPNEDIVVLHENQWSDYVKLILYEHGIAFEYVNLVGETVIEVVQGSGIRIC